MGTECAALLSLRAEGTLDIDHCDGRGHGNDARGLGEWERKPSLP